MLPVLIACMTGESLQGGVTHSYDTGVRAVWGPPVMGPPGPHNARDMGTGGAQISSVIGTGGPRISGDMGIL